MSSTSEEKENEWLQFMEFVKRKYGNNSSEFIRINEYNRRDSRSVAEHYSHHHDRTIATNAKLKDLLENTTFIALLNLDEPEQVSKFTEIYNETDYLMKSLNTKKDNIYIKCNPVDDNGVSVEGPDNMYTQRLNTIDAVLTEGAQSFSPNELYSNVGLQIFLCLLFMGIIYGIGYTIFNIIPSKIIDFKRKGGDAPGTADADV